MIPNKKKKRKLYKMEVNEQLEDSGVFAISLVSEPAIEELFVYMSKDFQMIQLAEVSNEKRMLVGPVLIPNKEITRYDDETGEEYAIIFSPEVVEKAAQMFLQQQKNNNATLEHMAEIDEISVVESWIIEDSLKDKSQIYNMTYPTGTWMVKMKINNGSVWEDYVKTGKVRGFSLEGMFGHKLVEASKAVEDNASKVLELSTIADNEFAEEMLEAIKGIVRKDLRVKSGQVIELESYTDYPESVKNAAKRGIELNEKVNNKCATSVGKIRAQQLAQGKPVSVQTIKRMYAYTSRAREFYNPDDTMACGTISYLLWGGDAANRWAESKLKELNELELETSVSIGSSYSGQFGDGTKKKPFKNGTYVAPALLSDEMNMDVFGYKTKYFQICPGAQITFKSLTMLPNLEEDNIGMVRSAAVIADAIFKIENDVLESEKASPAQLSEAMVLVDDYKDIISEIDEDNGTNTDVSYMDGHIETIKSFLQVELAEVGPRGGIKESPKAPDSDTPNPNPRGEGTAEGDASGKRGAEVSAEDEKTLKNKADEFNDRESNIKYGKANMGALKSVFQRGLGAYNTSRSPKVVSAKQWALARVNAFLYLLKNGRPENAGYTTDYDLLPKGHPKAE